MVFVTRHQATEILEPSEQALDSPAMSVSPQLATILSLGLPSVRFVGRDHFNPTFSFKPFIQLIAVVGLVANQLRRRLIDNQIIQRGLDQRYFMRRSTANPNAERKTMAVCDCHELATLSTLCFANTEAPFFALLKVPSIYASRTSSPPRSFKSAASAHNAASKVPSVTHSWKRRWQVAFDGYRGGKSSHRAPVFRIQRMPSSIGRASTRGRPRLSSDTGDSNSGWRISHCRSVSFISTLDHISRPLSIPLQNLISIQQLTSRYF
jgi:hypothetical protein